jgi:opacity protein-like surface antigen
MKINKLLAAGMLAALLVFGTAVPAFSADFPSPIEKGDILINGGFGIGMYGFTFKVNSNLFSATYEDPTLFGGYVSVDYALSLDLPLTLGIEIGYSGASFESPYKQQILNLNGLPEGSLGFIPILVRAAWHPNFGVENLDPFLMLKLGYGFGWLSGDFADIYRTKGPSGFGFGFDIGLRYFFTSHIGAYMEVGYERFVSSFDYNVNVTGSGITYQGSGPWDSPVQRFITFGITYKL